jgi:hypothetical protein
LSVASNDTSADQQDNVVAAARAAASWGRARRAAWTDVPLATYRPLPESRPAPATIAPPPRPIAAAVPPPRPIAAAPLPPPVPLPIAIPTPIPKVKVKTGPSVAARAAESVRALRMPGWLPRAAAAVVVAVVVIRGGMYLWNAVPARPARTAVVAPVAVRPPAAPASTSRRRPTGGLRVTSTPAAAQVFVDGKARGVTPVTISDLSVGRHTVELKSTAGTVERTVTIAADKTVDIEESIFAGWVAVYSPFDLTVTEGGRALLMDDRHQVMLSPGRHVLRLVNRTLAYDAVRQVDLKPGEVTTLTVTPPPSTMTVTATEAAEVWVDGVRIGATPVNAVSVPLGTHDVVVKRAAGGERKFTATVTVNPFTLHVDFSRPSG